MALIVFLRNIDAQLPNSLECSKPELKK